MGVPRAGALRASVGSTDARKSRARCFGVVGPTRAGLTCSELANQIGLRFRIAKTFGLSLRMIHFWAAYRKIPGPRMFQPSKPAIAPAVVVLSSPFNSADKRELSVGNQESAALR